ncbi:MAG: type IX secretion system sortase PorU [Muribaculaceae bacterium]|nr:type IX secretion system sortase PorU [Muribaculaceae bacterium]
MNRIYCSLLLLVTLILGSQTMSAFDPSVYTATSALAEGRWVKISVPSDGLYRISTASLRSWGIDPARAVVLGYGGHRQDVVLSKLNYIDDLPAAPQMLTERGLVFYGQGGPQWTADSAVDRYWLKQNDYSDVGCYFVGERRYDDEGKLPAADCREVTTTPVSTYMARLHHEQELVPSPGEAGPALLGEEMRNTRTRTFTFDIPDAVKDGYIWFKTSFVSNASASGKLSFTLNGRSITSTTSDNVAATSTSEYVHATETETRHTDSIRGNEGGKAAIAITYTGGGTVSGAWLNYLSVNYSRHLRMPSTGVLLFHSGNLALSLATTKASDLNIWDVTNPAAATSIRFNADADGATWQKAAGVRGPYTYVAWTPDAAMPEPAVVGVVQNQNLHSHRGIDMVIISPSAYAEQATRLADFHAKTDTMRVAVVDPEDIYNEFSSGTLDSGAFRRYLKMLYDRGEVDGHRLRYVLFFGRTTQDNRRLTYLAPDYPTLPSWMPEPVKASLTDNSGYCTDDIMVMLADGSGASLGSDKLSIAAGRIPLMSAGEGREIVDKLIQYATKSKKGAWKHRFLFLADDQDSGQHLTQTEKIIAQYENTTQGVMLPKKVYMDSYDFVGTGYPAAREDMFRALDEGVVWWNFVGHASTTGWTHEHQLQYTDLNNMYLRHWPFIAAYTCNFLRLDAQAASGGELLFKERYGGAIGMISAVRPVYISDNGLLSAAMGRAMGSTDEHGRFHTPGEMVRLAKNDVRDSKDSRPVSDENRLRYTFVGDPALPLALPSNRVVLDSIKGIAADGDNQPTLAALERATVKGHIAAPDGSLLSDFHGVLTVDIFDAERTVTTNGRGESGKVCNFEEFGARIYCGSATVRDGYFELTVAMPGEISQNFRPAAMSLYAYSDVDDTEAVSLNTDFYCYGYDESVEADTTAPVIETMVLNHDSFRDGDTVNDSPMLIATLSDDVSINVSNAGIGHQLTAILDGTTTFTGLSDYYTPSADGTPSGVLNYPLSDLLPGEHTLLLRAWDTSGNHSERSVTFKVAEGLAPKIYEVYSDANPASTTANFYLSHNQPDAMATITVSVYDMLGRPVWSGTASGRSDMFLSVPVTWDLTDGAGRRVPRGIYVYRAVITADGVNYETASRRIAVTAR